MIFQHDYYIYDLKIQGVLNFNSRMLKTILDHSIAAPLHATTTLV